MPVPGPVRATGRFLRVALICLVVLGCLPLLMVSGSRLAGGGSDRTAQLAPFAPLAGACWLLALVVLLALRSWWLAAAAGVLVGLHVFWLAPAVLQHLAADPVPDGTPWHVLTVNAQFGGANVDELAALVRSRSLDLVAVEEMTPEFETAFSAAVQQQLPSHVGHTSPDPAAGTGIWSRWPLQSEGVLPSRFTMPKARVTVPGVGTVEVIAVHTLSPIPGRVPGWRADLRMLARQTQDGSGPRIMLGDFNASRDHGPFRKVLSGPLIDAADASVLLPWNGLTWPADRRFIPPSVRIDHVLVSKNDFAVGRVRAVSVRGTDHRAVLADLVVLPVTGSAA